MTTLTYPGVYVQEVSSGVRPIAAASTSTAAFVGLAERGPDEEALRITSWTEFQRRYGTFIEGSFLAESVFQYFNNGGSQCYIVRITRGDAVDAFTTLQNRAETAQGVRFTATSPGDWANAYLLRLDDGSTDAGNSFRLRIYQQEEVDVVPSLEDLASLTPAEDFDGLSMDPASPRYVVTVLAQSSLLVRAADLVEDADPGGTGDLQRGVHFGGFEPTIPEDTELRSLRINIDGDGFQEIALPEVLADLDAVATAIAGAVQGLTPRRESTPPAAFTSFACTRVEVDGEERLELRSGTVDNRSSSVRVQNATSGNIATALNLGESNGGRSEGAIAPRRPANGVFQLGDATVAGAVSAATAGDDGDDALNELSFAAGFDLLDNKTDFSLLAVPGIGTATMVNEGMDYCQNRTLQDVFYIGEADQDTDTAAEARTFRQALTNPNSYGAIYFPWVRALDPSGRASEPILLPPSGYLAGLYARIDSRRGVWKAPAGTEATLAGVVGLAAELTDTEQGILNRINVNVLRRFPSAGIVSWGARTITSDTEFQYVPVRRMMIFLRVSIYNGIQWAVFEPNDEDLWSALRLNIGAFMNTLFRQGAFQGASPSDAYFVKVDAETTTQADIDQGVVNVLVGFAALKPAEFVVVRISQKAGQTS